MRSLPAVRRLALVALCGVPFVVAAQDAAASPPAPPSASALADYPTSERVTYVEACMRDHPDASHYEMLNKCSCALDFIARTVSFDDFDTLNTVSNAATIGGERGAEFRDVPQMQDKLKQFRKLQSDAQKNCMIAPPARK